MTATQAWGLLVEGGTMASLVEGAKDKEKM